MKHESVCELASSSLKKSFSNLQSKRRNIPHHLFEEYEALLLEFDAVGYYPPEVRRPRPRFQWGDREDSLQEELDSQNNYARLHGNKDTAHNGEVPLHQAATKTQGDGWAPLLSDESMKDLCDELDYVNTFWNNQDFADESDLQDELDATFFDDRDFAEKFMDLEDELAWSTRSGTIKTSLTNPTTPKTSSITSPRSGKTSASKFLRVAE